MPEEDRQQDGPPFIDLEKVIATKNPRLLKLLPGFVLRYIKRTIHQDEMNEFLKGHYKLQGLEFAQAVLDYFNVTVRIVGEENVPSEGGCILASNHPLGGLDGLVFLTAVGRLRKKKDVKFIVNDILLSIKNLADLWVPVNKHGKNSADVLELIDSTYRSEQAVLVFPAGLVSRKQEGKIADLLWRKSFVTQAKKHKRAIIPVFIDGKNSSFFYNFALLRKKVGIKANIEMFFLADEMFRQRNKTITIIFGKPVSYQSLNESKSDAEWAKEIRNMVYDLGK